MVFEALWQYCGAGGIAWTPKLVASCGAWVTHQRLGETSETMAITHIT